MLVAHLDDGGTTEAISMVAREMPDPIGTEFGLIADESTYGMPVNDALDRMARADAALVMAANQRLQIPAKLFEYIGAGKPVLALTEPDSATGRLVARARCGHIAGLTDVDAIADALERMLAEKRVGGLAYEPDADVVESLNIRHQTERLAHLLDGMSRG